MRFATTAGRLSLEGRSIAVPYRDPFRIARAHGGDGMTSVIVEVRHADWPDLVGYGEGYPDAYYGETIETIQAVLPLLLATVDVAALDTATAGAGERDAARQTPIPDETTPPARAEAARAEAALAAAGAAFDDRIAHHGAAKCAIDIALHDLLGKRLGLPVHRLLGLPAEIPPTDFTIGIDEPEIVAARAERANHFPALKIKLGGPRDLATLEAVRRVFDGPIRVDANTGWEPEAGARLLPDLVRLGVELIEQPFPRHRLDQLAWLQERSELPIVADESAVTIDDLPGLVGVVRGVNVKLAKCGGVGPAKRMLERARELGFLRFEGCMEETQVGIAASAAVASLADWVDLDGCLLLESDPFEGLELGADHRWRLTDAPGLGVRPVA